LVLRLASLLWRLRRTTTIETGLFEIEAEHPSEARRSHQISPSSREVVRAPFRPQASISSPDAHPACGVKVEPSVDPAAELTRRYFRSCESALTSRSTASVDTRQRCGAKSASFPSPLMPWIAATSREKIPIPVVVTDASWQPLCLPLEWRVCYDVHN
jgi:hypothetical protein